MAKWLTASLLAVAGVVASIAFAQAEDKTAQGFAEYVTALKAEAQQKGFDESLLNDAFNDISFRPTVIKSDKNQPEKKITLDSYLASRVPDWKVQQAVEMYNKHKSLLEEIGQKFQVQPRFIVALWGNESNFGRIQGNYSVLSALASLAYEGRREKLFKDNLFAALTILDEGHTSVDALKGSWAGAMGQSQFMPISFLNYAVDYDGDGRKDIWQTEADVFASIANYLSSEGWDNNGTWGRQVSLTQPIKEFGLSKSLYKPLADWQQAGVRRFDGSDLPNADIPASLIMPDGSEGRVYLVYNNFHTLMKWNRSSYFGVSVGYLSERIKRGY
ncbi:Membrane-bound lytic murein transglycosylase B [Alteromonas sp. 38]|uniref:lytic murein transglycosylase n=1 Tax=Alteromonas TaxID=226 RepID=UPI0012F2C6E5|nr:MULTISPECIES: lytic murein transglycosylase [Alteromonas]CAD5268885.1 Membrane-bound lytic murein transglycosylase B [Alteromonas sp. 154]VXC01332.1 Membrane-bound lytic murein transglycosylase B [Alteromonas sp. 38]